MGGRSFLPLPLFNFYSSFFRRINEKQRKKVPKYANVGGQAVLEGVMMKSGERVSVSVRREDGTIKTKNSEFVSVRKKCAFFRLPIIRGVVNFVEMMILSFKTLDSSASLLGIDETETKFEKWLKKKFGKSILDVLIPISAVLGVALALLIFMYLPALATSGIEKLAGRDLGAFKGIIEGIMKIAIFIAYISLVSLMPDIRRTFEYHGAEHKSIFCYEKKLPLTVENVKAQRRFHPRCGTSFMFVMIILGIIIGLFITWDNRLVRVLCKILTLPLVVGIGYEFLMFSAKHDNIVTKVLTAPGLWIQRITTREPDASQIEVAIRSLKCALPDEFPEETAIVEAENAAEKTDVSEKSDGTSSENPAAESTGENGNTHSSEEETTVETDGHDSAAS